jgi:D-serine deaminase-like pyridoxal phosphate-dependent protein
MVDSRAGLDALGEAMSGVDRSFPFAVEVDVSLKVLGLHLGVRRSPLRSAADVLPLVQAAPEHLRFAGLMAYEAQIAGLAYQSPHHRAQNPAASLVRKRSVKAVARQRQEVFEALRDAGHTPSLFNGAGTGSMSFASGEPWLSELTAGSGLLCPHLFDHYSNLDLEPAAFFAVQVVRTPAPGFVTCLGGGYVASGTPGWDKVPVPWLPRGLKLVGAEGCGEVQTPLEVTKELSLAPGDPVVFRHAKAGELAERFADYLLVEEGAVTRAPTYRGLGRCFF